MGIRNSKTLVTGNKAIISSSDLYMKHEGIWKPLPVPQELPNGYVTFLDANTWIKFVYANKRTEDAVKASMTKNIIGRSKYGPLIDTKVLSENVLEYDILTSGNVSNIGPGVYQFDDAKEVDIGITCRDLKRTLGNKVSFVGNRVVMDFTELRADPKIGIVNLDPEVVLGLSDLRVYTINAVGSPTTIQTQWDIAHDATDSDSSAGISLIASYQVTWIPASDDLALVVFRRSLFEFDISGFENATNVIFETGNEGLTGGENYIRICQPLTSSIATPLSDPADLANYGAIKTSYEANAATLTYVHFEEDNDVWRSGDLGPNGENMFNTASSTVYYGVVDQKDAEDGPVPTVTESRITGLDGLAPTTLTLTLPSTGDGTTRLTTSMRRRFK